MVSVLKNRRIRSFVLRQGRISARQHYALQEYLPLFSLDNEKPPYDWEAIFGRQAPRVLEIGFGMGENLLSSASKAPETDFIGIEVYSPGIGHCLAQAHQQGLMNLKVFTQDALAILSGIPAASLDKVWVLFPDPWPKKRHHKRRLVQEAFVQEIARILKPSGLFHLATDWQPYAEQMLAVLEACSLLAVANLPLQHQRESTKFERRGQKLGHPIVDFIYQRII